MIMMEQPIVSGIAFNRDEAKLTALAVWLMYRAAAQIIGPISDANIEVDMIIQNTARDKSTDFTFTVHRNDYERAKRFLSNKSLD